jgi:hypothetical protein
LNDANNHPDEVPNDGHHKVSTVVIMDLHHKVQQQLQHGDDCDNREPPLHATMEGAAAALVHLALQQTKHGGAFHQYNSALGSTAEAPLTSSLPVFLW